jgi:hypothetical protein
MTSVTTPEIILGWTGEHEPVRSDLLKHAYRDLSTVIVMPTRGMIPARVVDSFMSLIRPPNCKTTQLFISGMEVGHAYNEAINMILHNDQLSQWQYMLTIEEDNLLPPDALVALQKEMIDNDWDVLGALYFTKGEGGVPQIWGDPYDPEENYRPQTPIADKVVECNGTGMGCTLWKIETFRKIEPPWFVTQKGEAGLWTQDLYFFHQARQQGIELCVGVDCRIKVGHLDVETGDVW